MQTARLVEGVLVVAERVGELREQAGIDREGVAGDVMGRFGADGIDRRLAAHAAGAGRVEVARQVGAGQRDAMRECHIEHVVGVLTRRGAAVGRPERVQHTARGGVCRRRSADLRHAEAVGSRTTAVDRRTEVAPRLHHPFGDEESRRQLDVVPRRAHRDHERLPRDADLERLLHRESVGPAPLAVREGDSGDRPPRRDPSHTAMLRARVGPSSARTARVSRRWRSYRAPAAGTTGR